MVESKISESNLILSVEDKLARFIGQRYCILVGTGTIALIVALKSLNVPKGSGFLFQA
ncbi:MAG: hypothetical protein BWX81_00381 [Spirochaetes bacterium ADurb.Bin110]|nr:MAG: hypothetical protein BWX81_00381 [Spirochaetes bacterium ADurb.Bin110]